MILVLETLGHLRIDFFVVNDFQFLRQFVEVLLPILVLLIDMRLILRILPQHYDFVHAQRLDLVRLYYVPGVTQHPAHKQLKLFLILSFVPQVLAFQKHVRVKRQELLLVPLQAQVRILDLQYVLVKLVKEHLEGLAAVHRNDVLEEGPERTLIEIRLVPDHEEVLHGDVELHLLRDELLVLRVFVPVVQLILEVAQVEPLTLEYAHIVEMITRLGPTNV